MADIEQEVRELVDIDELADVDIGMNQEAVNQLAAYERVKCATEYQRLKIRADNLTASIIANKAVGNDKVVKQFQEQLETIQVGAKHLLRSIKTIDKQYPNAKATQEKILQQQLSSV